MSFSERSDRLHPTPQALGSAEERARVAGGRVDPDRVAIAPSAASIYLALFYVLADAGEEVVVAAGSGAAEAAIVSGLDVVELQAPDAQSVFDAVGERTRVIVVGAVDDETMDVLTEIALPIVSTDATLIDRANSAGERAPLTLVVGQDDERAWLVVLGPADRAEPLLTRLEWHARVFFARAGRS